MEMKVKKQDVSNNPDNGKNYERAVNVCEMCDIWVTVEEPTL